MKYLFLFLLLTFFALTTLGCRDSGNVEEVTPDTEDADSISQSSPENIEISLLPEENVFVEYLELCYATSINTPENQYGPENVFDGNSSTFWATMPGAAPDEGLFFSFEEAIEIETIQIETLTGSADFDSVKYIRLYLNGVEGPEFQTGVQFNLSSQPPVKSIFIKVISTESIDFFGHGIRYTREVPVAITEVNITVLDDEGTEVPLKILPITRVSGTIEASSSLDPEEAYNPDFLFDSRLAFGWADGNPDLAGVDESLVFNFEEPTRIEKISIWNGYQRSAAHFNQNERAALISFNLEGQTIFEYRLDDSMSPQIITLETPLEGNSFNMNFLEVYAGDVYQDLVVSELRFFDGTSWFVIDSGDEVERKESILNWASTCDAQAFIDKQIFEYGRIDDITHRQSIIIRSNGSFVIWTFDGYYDFEERMYADGNWQILEDNQLRIFGRLHRLASYEQYRADPYSGSFSGEQEVVDRITIFSDTLSFSKNWISSSRGVIEDFNF